MKYGPHFSLMYIDVERWRWYIRRVHLPFLRVIFRYIYIYRLRWYIYRERKRLEGVKEIMKLNSLVIICFLQD